MAFPTAVNDQITDELVQTVMSHAGIEEARARTVVEAIIGHLAGRDVLLNERYAVDTAATAGAATTQAVSTLPAVDAD